jgi:hypothetical protein
MIATQRLTYENPVWYKDYRIYESDCGPRIARFSFVHKDYDGDDDKRCGYGFTVSDCKNEIDEITDDEAAS